MLNEVGVRGYDSALGSTKMERKGLAELFSILLEDVNRVRIMARESRSALTRWICGTLVIFPSNMGEFPLIRM